MPLWADCHRLSVPFWNLHVSLLGCMHKPSSVWPSPGVASTSVDSPADGLMSWIDFSLRVSKQARNWLRTSGRVVVITGWQISGFEVNQCFDVLHMLQVSLLWNWSSIYYLFFEFYIPKFLCWVSPELCCRLIDPLTWRMCPAPQIMSLQCCHPWLLVTGILTLYRVIENLPHLVGECSECSQERGPILAS